MQRDFGFAPNPFHGFCTLATCKPVIRRVAKVGDWIIGTGSADSNRTGHIVYAMRVSETMPFDSYWEDPRFLAKRPRLRGSRKRAFGDNIYHRDPDSGLWLQEDSHHSLQDGSPDPKNTGNDTKTDRVLISDDFIYWGGSGPKLPEFNGVNICKSGQSHRSKFPDDVVSHCVQWLRSCEVTGYLGKPLKWI